ncbi:MAG: DUF1456 domain-containing protein [Salinivirgaceae bacterium]|nr:MAG: DUF1456 domain-containing protein [Salinivirgaceae bacterium]
MLSNNDILRRLRYSFDFYDDRMIELFSLGDFVVNRSQVSDWLKKDDDEQMQKLSDQYLAAFLNGLIAFNRGEKEGPKPIPERRLTNNIILRKLKIALNLKDDDMIEIFKLAGTTISKPELSAFFRKPTHDKFRECQDQYLRNFLKGIQLKYRKD